MSTLSLILSVILAILPIIMIYQKKQFDKEKEENAIKATDNKYSEARVKGIRDQEFFWTPNLNKISYIIAFIFLCFGLFNKLFFYADPSYNYHIKTIMGDERAVTTLGYSYYGAGTYTSWKKGMTVQAASNIGATNKDQTSENEKDVSANLQPPRLIFLDQVDAKGSATVRFRIPDDPAEFLRMAREYRIPSNLLKTELIPAFKTTLQATASLMSAEEYFSGARTDFINEFDSQIRDGIYIVKREQVIIKDAAGPANASANASKGIHQDKFGDGTKIVFKVKKQYDNGVLRKTKQTFVDFGITVVSARVTDMVPNDLFINRMKAKQKASADKAVAREKRSFEVQSRLLAIAKGEREIAEKQAAAKVVQIEKTTNAETAKQLALTVANQAKEQAIIDKQTSKTLLEKAKIDANAIKIIADAEAYKRSKIIKSDNALQAKLDTELAIQKVWADAYANRAVPQYVFGSNGNTPTGGDSETSNLMKLMTLQAAKVLNYDRAIKVK